jgi:hypothetical protein
MADNKVDVVALTEEENKELNDGRALYEMDKSSVGWQIVKSMLEGLAYHSWVDPRTTASKEEWEWQELNAFHAANTAKDIMEEISKVVSRSEYLDKVRTGEIQRKSMTIR